MDKIKPAARYARGYYHGMGGESGPTMDLRDDGDWVRYTDHSAAIVALLAEVERLRVDAKRYRWLRERAAKLAIYSDTPVDVLIDGEWRDKPGELDAAIDAAMQGDA